LLSACAIAAKGSAVAAVEIESAAIIVIFMIGFLSGTMPKVWGCRDGVGWSLGPGCCCLTQSLRRTPWRLLGSCPDEPGSQAVTCPQFDA
jgi:hypothetical protein